MAKIYLLVAGVMLCSIPDCPLDNKLFIHLRQMKTIPSQSCLEHRHDFKFHLRRENITPIQMTQGTCYHQQALQQIFDLFTTGSSCATWNSALLDKLLQPGSEPGIAGRSDSGLSRLGNCCPEVFTRNPSLSEPGRLSEWKLKSAFPSCKNPQEKSTDTMKIIHVTTFYSIRLLFS